MNVRELLLPEYFNFLRCRNIPTKGLHFVLLIFFLEESVNLEDNRMGTGKNDSMHGANVSGSEFVKSAQRNDLSNPQQGTGVAKTTTNEKRDNGPKKNYDQNSVPAKSSVTNQANHWEDKRKLFVGGLPTDSKYYPNYGVCIVGLSHAKCS